MIKLLTRDQWRKKMTHGIHSRNLVESKPPKYLLPERLPNINQYIAMFLIALAIIYKQRCIAPKILKIKIKYPKWLMAQNHQSKRIKKKNKVICLDN